MPQSPMNSTALPDQWDTWGPSLSNSVLRLHDLMRATSSPMDDSAYHPLDRPGLLVSVSGNNVCLFLSKGFKGKELISITRYAYVDSPAADAQLTLEVQGGELLAVYPQRTWNDQSNDLRNNAKRILPNMVHVLNKTVTAVEKGTPLEGGSWETCLMRVLRRSEKFSPFYWRHWVQTWGTPRMQEVASLVNDLIDPSKDTEAWRLAALNLLMHDNTPKTLEIPMLDGTYSS